MNIIGDNLTDEEIDRKCFELCSEMRPWDGKSSPKSTPQLLVEAMKWARDRKPIVNASIPTREMPSVLDDLKQYMTNLLYNAYKQGTEHDGSFFIPDVQSPEFDKWVEENVNNIVLYFKS